MSMLRLLVARAKKVYRFEKRGLAYIYTDPISDLKIDVVKDTIRTSSSWDFEKTEMSTDRPVLLDHRISKEAKLDDMKRRSEVA